MQLRAAVAAFWIGVLAAGEVAAAGPASIMGKWVERFANGSGMLTEFAPDSISYYPVGHGGKPGGEARKAIVAYKDLGGDLVGVQFPGYASSAILLLRTGPDSLTMDFPGLGAHALIRVAK